MSKSKLSLILQSIRGIRGPPLNSSGEVIVIVTAIVSEAQGMAVGIPIRGICDSLIACSNGGLRLDNYCLFAYSL